MENINGFNILRIFQIINRQLVMGMKPWIIGIAAGAGFLLGIYLLQILTLHGIFNLDAFTNLGFVILFVGGFIFTSNIFNELQSPVKSHFYLTLPARAEEKLIAAWLMSSLLYVIASLIVLFLVSLILSGVLVIFYGGKMLLFNPLTEYVLTTAGVYMVLQTIFLLGSVYFRKFNFLKTLLTIFIVYMIIFVWVIMMAFLIIRPQDMMFGIDGSMFQGNIVLAENFSTMMSVLFWYVLGPLFLVVSYFRLKERQV